jgi:hypothetical protein
VVDKYGKDQHRYGLKGTGLKGLSKVVETEKWGRDAANERYGKLKSEDTRPPDRGRPQFRQDQSVKGAGDTPDGWLRGKGGSGMGPNFQKSKF